MPIDLGQIKAARVLAKLKQSELAQEVGISVTALQNIENGSADPRYSIATSILRVLEEHGVMFTEHGIKLKK